jgi:hypothetical protein
VKRAVVEGRVVVRHGVHQLVTSIGLKKLGMARHIPLEGYTCLGKMIGVDFLAAIQIEGAALYSN